MSNASATVAARPATCPECGETFKDLRGLNGHMRFKHNLPAEEVNEIITEKKEAREREEAEIPPPEPDQPVMMALDRLVRAESRRDAAEELLKAMKTKNFVGERWEIGFLTPTIPEKEVAKEYVERCEEEYENAKDALKTAISREAERRE